MQTMKEIRWARRYNQMCLFILFAVVSASSFSAFFDKWHFREPGGRGFDPVAGFDQIMDGTAWRPYIYRQLLPDLTYGIDGALPVNAIGRHVSEDSRHRVIVALDLAGKTHPVQYITMYLILYLSALLGTYALYWVCRAANISPLASVFTPVIFMLLFPLFGVKGGYYFDYPELLFMALAVWIALGFDWWWIIPIAALGAWNKESFLLFVLTLYPLLRRRNSRVTSLLAVGVLAGVCAAVYLPIRMHFAHNPGGTVEFHLKDQIDFFVHPFRLATWTDRTYGLLLPALSGPIPILLLIWTVWRAWRHLPLWLKRHAQIAAIINIPLFLLFCQPGEFRDLSMLSIVFLLILATNLQAWIESLGPKPLQSTA